MNKEFIQQHFVNFELEYNKNLAEMLHEIVCDYEENNLQSVFVVRQVITNEGNSYTAILDEFDKE